MTAVSRSLASLGMTSLSTVDCRLSTVDSDIIPPMPERVDWHTYFMNIARQVATRATCPRKHVGAVIARDRTILSTGYNGSVRGLPHCEDVGCVMEDGHCVWTVHAEANAIIQAAKNGVSVTGAELYTTASPCWPCFKLIANAGITKVYYGEFYRDEKSLKVAREAGIELVDLGASRQSTVDDREAGKPSLQTKA